MQGDSFTSNYLSFSGAGVGTAKVKRNLWFGDLNAKACKRKKNLKLASHKYENKSMRCRSVLYCNLLIDVRNREILTSLDVDVTDIKMLHSLFGIIQAGSLVGSPRNHCSSSLEVHASVVPLIDLSIRGHIGLVVDAHLYFLAGLLGVLWDGVTAFGKLWIIWSTRCFHSPQLDYVSLD